MPDEIPRSPNLLGRAPHQVRGARTTAVSEVDPHAHRVQTLRGFACFLLVAFHVVVDNSTQGIDLQPGSIYQDITSIFAHLRMPLFTFLSGYVYAYRPARRSAEHQFVQKKLRRLLLPFVTVTTLFYVFQLLTDTVWSGQTLKGIYLLSYAHLWFLQALMLIFILVYVLERLKAMQTFVRFAAVMAGALMVHFLVKVSPNWFSITQACYLLPFFLIGVGANRFRNELEKPVVQWLIISLFILTMTMHILAVFGYGTVFQQRTLLGTTLSLTGCLTLIYKMPGAGWLRRIGVFSFGIYLLHVFFTAGTRLVLDAAGVAEPLIYFCAGLGCGIAGPILVEKLLHRQHLARRMLLGQS